MSSLGRTYEIENKAFCQLIGTKQEYHEVICVLFAWVIRLKKASDNTDNRPLHDSVPNPVINDESITKGIILAKCFSYLFSFLNYSPEEFLLPGFNLLVTVLCLKLLKLLLLETLSYKIVLSAYASLETEELHCKGAIYKFMQ